MCVRIMLARLAETAGTGGEKVPRVPRMSGRIPQRMRHLSVVVVAAVGNES